MTKKITVFCGSSSGQGDELLEDVYKIGCLLAHNNFQIIYGGGSKGLMGALADGALSQKSLVHGIIPRFMVEREWLHKNISSSKIVETLSERKELLQETDIFLILPGGLGTLEELSQILSWKQLGLLDQEIYIYNYGDFFTPLMEFFKKSRQEEFIYSELIDSLILENTVENLIVDILHQ